MENSQPQRIAFVINSLTGNELLGGREDGNRIYNLLIDDKYGNCSKKDSRNLINCKEKANFK